MKLLYPPLQKLADYVFTQYRDFDQRCELRGIAVNAAICANCHKDSYYRGRPAYECDNFKQAYLWRFLSAHIVQTEQPLSMYVVEQVCRESNIRALSLGGGPGTEAIALMNLLHGRTGNFSITFDNLEAEPSWQPFYDDLVNRFAGYLKNIKINARFKSSTAVYSMPTNPTTAYHIVFASWLLSESDVASERENLLAQLWRVTRRNGYLVVMDREEDTLINEIQELLQGLDECSEVEADFTCQGYAGVSFPDELKEIFMPKLNYQTAYWVLRRS